MKIFNSPLNNKQAILALGAESAGNFSAYLPFSLTQGSLPDGRQGLKEGPNGFIYFSPDFGDLLDENNFNNFKKTVLNFLKKEKIKPDVIISDLHPLIKTTLWGEELAKKYKAKHIQIQHHHAHIFSAIGDSILPLPLVKDEIERGLKYIPRIVDREPRTMYGIALDGTGYGTDEKIWGGEVFELKIKNEKLKIVERIGSLEDQIMIGGELAIKEPARILISILKKIRNPKFEIRNKSENKNSKTQKNFVYGFVKKYHTKNEFELLYNQLEQNFNCIETSSTGRILDAVSLLLGFCKNERKYKHEPIDLLEKNSTKPYTNLKPKIIEVKNKNNLLENSSLEIDSKLNPPAGGQNSKFILDTTYLFRYLIENIDKDKHRLAATAQLYIAQGLHQIIKKYASSHESVILGLDPGISKDKIVPNIFASGGITNNNIISNYFASKNIYLNQTIPRGDAGLSFGQIAYFLFNG